MPGALESVSFCDEIVVVDGGSTDRTVEISRRLGAKVVESPWPGFAAQRNVALDAATCEWVLELDADERVTPRLRASIEELLASPPERTAIAVCPLRHRFLGRLLGPSAKYPAYRSRLFRRGAYRHDEARKVHEGLEPHERPAILDGDLEHALAMTLGEALRDAWRYARLESSHLERPSGHGAYLKRILLRPAAKIVYRTLIDEGWRDGWQGMLKILLDASSDALVWVLVLITTKGSHGPTAEGEGHFGRRPAGPPKIVALAARGDATKTARGWLKQLQSRGVDVVLLSDEREPPNDVPTKHVQRLLPLAAIRALDVEMQLRTIHAVVPFGRKARFVWSLLPRTLRPEMPGLDAWASPDEWMVSFPHIDNVIS